MALSGVANDGLGRHGLLLRLLAGRLCQMGW